MDAKYLASLYKKQIYDELVTPFDSEAGFSVVRLYPNSLQYHKDGKRIFIKIAVSDDALFYGVDMVNPEKKENGDIRYAIVDSGKYKNKVTNFVSGSDESEFYFDIKENNIIYKKTGKKFTLNEFIDILERNHLRDRLFIKKKLNSVVNIILRIIFILSNRHYDKIEAYLDRSFRKYTNETIEDHKSTEPFFKYFNIPKNSILLFLVMSLLILVTITYLLKTCSIEQPIYPLDDLTLSNPIVILLLFIGLFFTEKISVAVDKRINSFLRPDQSSDSNRNFIEKLHDFQFQNKFKLKINLRNSYGR